MASSIERLSRRRGKWRFEVAPAAMRGGRQQRPQAAIYAFSRHFCREMAERWRPYINGHLLARVMLAASSSRPERMPCCRQRAATYYLPGAHNGARVANDAFDAIIVDRG